MSGLLSIGALAKATGTKVVTIRYYEQIGLLPAPPRREGSNYRAYGSEHLRQLGFIRRARELGFSLDQIRALISLSNDPGHDCADVDRLAREHLGEVHEKIADLTRLAAELERLSRECHGGTVADCRIMDALGPA